MKRRGFTLLEVLLALVLLVGLMLAVLGFYHRVLDVRRTVLDYAKAVAARRMVMQRITRDLEDAFNEPGIGQVLEGTGASLRLVTARVPGPGVWLADNDPNAPKPEQDDVQIVTYALDTGQNGDGNTTVLGLDRGVQKLLTATQVEEGSTLHTVLITSRVNFIAFSYFDGSAWTSTWQGNALPAGVQVTLGSQPLPEGADPADYPYAISRRIIAIPAGVRAAGGTIIRGLGQGAGG